MQTIKLLKSIEHEGLAKDDVISVDEFSAAALIARGDAQPYEPPAAEQERPRTIDDLVDPNVARNKRVMTATVVGGPAEAPVVRPPDLDPSTPTAVADDTTTAEVEAALEAAGAIVGADGVEHTGVVPVNVTGQSPSTEDTPPTSETAEAPAKNTKARGGKTTGTPAASDAQSAGGDAGGGTA